MTDLPPQAPRPSEIELAARGAAYRAATAAGIWQERFRFGIVFFGLLIDSYITLAHAGRPRGLDHADLAEYRRLARAEAYRWHLIDDEAAPPLAPGEIDRDLAEIAGLGSGAQH